MTEVLGNILSPFYNDSFEQLERDLGFSREESELIISNDTGRIVLIHRIATLLSCIAPGDKAAQHDWMRSRNINFQGKTPSALILEDPDRNLTWIAEVLERIQRDTTHS